MSTHAIALWESDQKDALKAYVTDVASRCVELMEKSNKTAAILEGCNKTHDCEVVESFMESVHKFCAGQVDSIKEAVTNLCKNERSIEEIKGDTTGWADEVQSAVNAVEYVAWKPISYVVGGPQLTQEATGDIANMFKSIRDDAEAILKMSITRVTEMSESNATFADSFIEINDGIKKVFSAMVESLNDSKKDFRAMAEDSAAIVTKLRSSTGTVTGDASSRSIASAKDVRKNTKDAADAIV